MSSRIFRLNTLFIILLAIFIGLPINRVSAVGADLTDRILISDREYEKLTGSNTTTNSDILEEELIFSGKWDATSLGATINPGDFFTINLDAKDPKHTLVSGTFDLTNELGQVLGDLVSDAETGIVTVTFNDDIVGLSDVKGTFTIKTKLRLSEGENTITYPDGSTQNYTVTKIDNIDDLVSSTIIRMADRLLKSVGETTTNSVKVLNWDVRFNYSKYDYSNKYVVLSDVFDSRTGILMTIQEGSLVLEEMDLSQNRENVARQIPIVTDKAQFVAGTNAYLEMQNGGLSFNLNLGNQVGTKSYRLKYNSNPPEPGLELKNNFEVNTYTDLEESIVTNPFKNLFTVEGETTTDQSGTPGNQTGTPDTSTDSKSPDFISDTESFKEPVFGGTIEGVNNGKIRLTKYDSNSATKVLSGATFNIFKKSEPNNILDTITTDENGIAISKYLGEGEFILVETVAPAGYKLNSNPISVTVKASEISYIAVGNTPGESEQPPVPPIPPTPPATPEEETPVEPTPPTPPATPKEETPVEPTPPTPPATPKEETPVEPTPPTPPATPKEETPVEPTPPTPPATPKEETPVEPKVDKPNNPTPPKNPPLGNHNNPKTGVGVNMLNAISTLSLSGLAFAIVGKKRKNK